MGFQWLCSANAWADVGGEVEGAKGADRAVVSRQGLGQCHAVRDGGCRLCLAAQGGDAHCQLFSGHGAGEVGADGDELLGQGQDGGEDAGHVLGPP